MAELFDTANLDATCEALAMAGEADDASAARTEGELGATIPGDESIKDQIRRMVLQLRDITSVLATADPKDKADVYRELAVQVHYDPHRCIGSVSAGPCTTARIAGGTCNVARHRWS